MSIYDVYGNVIDCSNIDEQLDDLVPNRLLIWHDEFKGPDIDSKKWNHIYSKDYAKDIQLVTSVKDELICRTIRDYRKGSGNTYSSPELLTLGLFEFRYGRIEAKIKFTSASPYHITFWTLGSCYSRRSVQEGVSYDDNDGVLFPSCGEIDIAEYDNGGVGARTHWSSSGFDTDTVYQTGGNIDALTSTPNAWHIYACEWTETSIAFYVDGIKKGEWATSNALVNGWNPFQHPHFLLMNGVPNINGVSQFEIAETEVKWVRVYAPAGITEPISAASIEIPQSASIRIGQRYFLNSVFTPSNVTDMTLTWLSHNEDIVTCYSGMLIGVSAGTTYVQARTNNGLTALCKVTVSE